MKKQKTLKLQFNKNIVSKFQTYHVSGGDIHVSGGHNTCPSVWCSELNTACCPRTVFPCLIQPNSRAVKTGCVAVLATQVGQHTCMDVNGNLC
ncbi:hypothetical protein [Kordia sp.]|uniref:hypothetical protein n=1 Tax=Kordia sp. TaxID=1965332 RepID=UPI003D2DD8CD